MTEIWKDIDGYEGLYQVSNLGRVRSLGNDKKRKEKLLKPGTQTKGYLHVTLCKDGNKKMYRINRLVALAFIKNDDPEHKNEVNHLNEDKTDNRVCNLNWMSPKENINYGTGNERRSQKLINHPDKSTPVKQLTLDGTLVAIWPSAMEAQRNGFNQGHIWACCQGKQNKHKGFHWEYA